MTAMRDATEANLLYIASEIERMGEELSLSPDIMDFGVQLYAQAVKNGYRPATIDRATATCLYVAARVRDAPVTIDNVAAVSRREAKNIYHETSTLSDVIGLQVEPDDPADFVEEYAKELQWPDDATDRALELCEHAKDANVHSGRSPSGFAASVLYARSEVEELGYTQSDIAETASTSTVTIRNTYPEIMPHAPDTEPKDLASRDFEFAIEVLQENIDVPDVVSEEARRRARNINKNEITRGQSRAAIAAAAYLVVADEHNIDLNQTRLADVVGTNSQTVAKYKGVV
jgi:transcription initiation factor TFIIB